MKVNTTLTLQAMSVMPVINTILLVHKIYVVNNI